MVAGPSLMFLLMLLMAGLLVIGLVLVLSSRRRGKDYPQCGGCGYNVTASIGTTTRCPECGSEFAVVGVTPVLGRGKPAAMWIGIVLIALPITCVGTGLVLSLALRSAAQSRAAQATAAAQAAAAQQQAIMRQSQLARLPADPARVAAFRQQIAGMGVYEASARLTAVVQELAQRQTDQTLDEDSAASLLAERQALYEHLNSDPPIVSTATAAGGLPPPLTQEQVDVMSESEVRNALTAISRIGRQVINDPALTEQRKREFGMLMKRLKELQEAQRREQATQPQTSD